MQESVTCSTNNAQDVHTRALQQVQTLANSSKGNCVNLAFSQLRTMHFDVANLATLKATLLALMKAICPSCICHTFCALHLQSLSTTNQQPAVFLAAHRSNTLTVSVAGLSVLLLSRSAADLRPFATRSAIASSLRRR